jgi:hypothetical protein
MFDRCMVSSVSASRIGAGGYKRAAYISIPRGLLSNVFGLLHPARSTVRWYTPFLLAKLPVFGCCLLLL